MGALILLFQLVIGQEEITKSLISDQAKLEYIVSNIEDQSAHLKLYLDTQAPFILNDPISCINLICRVLLPFSIRDTINTVHTNHELSITLSNNAGESEKSLPITIDNPSTCQYAAKETPTIMETRPIGYAIEGFNSKPWASRIGQLRQWGWKVQWQYDPTKDKVLVMAWCIGTPQN